MATRDIHSRIAYARLAADLTQEQVAAHFGIRRESVAQWEGGRSKPAVSRVIELAKLLNTTPEWILNGEGDPPTKKDKPPQTTDPITPELEREYLERLRRADPKVRESVLTLLGVHLRREG